jgi:23S rRNA (cytosine1962-C5)-methyltransferase
LLRPDQQVIWPAAGDLKTFKGLTAYYSRSETGGGFWQYNSKMPDNFVIGWRDLKFKLKLMGFKHTGLFPEQAVNWAKMIELIKGAGRPIEVLNLFALSAGASVCHVDSAKAMVERAGENIKLSGLEGKTVRYIIDDCLKFVKRELKRGRKYDAIIMDPPSFGRGPNGAMWKIEENLFDLVKETKGLLSETPLFYLINSYTTGLQPSIMSNILKIALDTDAIIEADEIGLPTEEKGVVLPAGASAFAIFLSPPKTGAI